MRIASWSLAFYRLPYVREVVWADAVEDAGTFALLRLAADTGAVGIAEGTIKTTWSGVSPRSLGAAIEDIWMPRLRGVDLDDPEVVTRALAGIPENGLAKTLVDNACWTLRAAVTGEPLWRTWGGDREIEVTWTVTRQAPARMAAEAAEMCGRHGFRTLKVKGGQGVEVDLRALREIRAAVGPPVELYVDANGAYARSEGLAYVNAIADAGATVAEDPCPLAPDREFEALQRGSRLPILVDSGCGSARDAALYLDRGAQALSTKPGRVGLGEAREMARLAAAHGAKVTVGLYAESALGTLVSLQQAAAVPAAQRIAAAEQTFFLTLREQIVNQEVRIRNGEISLPTDADLARLVDWERVKRFTI